MRELKLNTNIFSMSYIKKAVNAYAKISKIKIIEKGDYLICNFSDCFYGEEKTVREFENYLIDLINTDIAL